MNLTEHLGQIVRVHLNLHNGLYSISRNGKVLGYAPAVELTDCSFIITERLQQMFEQRPSRRTVHAFIRGRLMGFSDNRSTSGTRLTCNPFTHLAFARAKDGLTAVSASKILLHTDRSIEAYDLVVDSRSAVRATPLTKPLRTTR